MHALRLKRSVLAAKAAARGLGLVQDRKPSRLSYIWVVAAAVAAVHFGGGRATVQGAEVDEVLNRMHAFRAEHGEAPTLANFWKLACDDSGRFRVERSDRRAIWEAFCETQQGAISKPDLLDLHQATRDAIFDLQFNCELEQRKYEGGVARSMGPIKSTFAMTETKILLWTDKTRDGTDMPYLTAYDGDKVRTSVTHAGATTAQVLNFDSWSSYFVADSNLLFGTMLLDSPRTMGFELPLHDLRLFLDMPGAIVFEERRSIRGYDCAVVGTANFLICVAPTLNFAVVQLSQFASQEDAPPRLAYRCDLSDFVDLGNGVWLPRKMERRFYADGPSGPSLVNEDIATFSDLRINQEIPDALFRDAIPKGTKVWDTVQGITYIEGDKSSIQSLVDGAIPPTSAGTDTRSGGGPRIWLLLSNLVVFAVIVLVFLWLRRRGRGQPGTSGPAGADD